MPKQKFHKQDLPLVAETLLKNSMHNCFCFYGDMGVGKTTLIKELLKELGAVDLGNSPTFGLVNEYHDNNGKLLAYHFDFYRIEHEEEVFDMGIEDYFSSGAYIFIEWPEKIPNLIPLKSIKVNLHFIDENTRSIEY